MTPEERDDVFAQGKEAGAREERERIAAWLDRLDSGVDGHVFTRQQHQFMQWAARHLRDDDL